MERPAAVSKYGSEIQRQGIGEIDARIRSVVSLSRPTAEDQASAELDRVTGGSLENALVESSGAVILRFNLESNYFHHHHPRIEWQHAPTERLRY